MKKILRTKTSPNQRKHIMQPGCWKITGRNTHQALRLTCPAPPPGRWPEQALGPSASEQRVIGVSGRCAFREAAECRTQGLCAFWPAVGQSQGLCAWRQAERRGPGLRPHPPSAPQQETDSWNKRSLLWGGPLLGLSADAHTPGATI